jgi:Helix-turn-helix domain
MSEEELRRVEVLARVRSRQLREVDASRLLGVSYRQAKRRWKRYREEGLASLKHRSAGAPRIMPMQVLDQVRKRYGGPVGERFGPTLAAEHLDAEDGSQGARDQSAIPDGNKHVDTKFSHWSYRFEFKK